MTAPRRLYRDMDDSELVALRRDLGLAVTVHAETAARLRGSVNKINSALAARNGLRNGHAKITPKKAVTDHAVVRYLERVMEIDIDTLRQEIFNEIEAGEPVPRSGELAVRFKGYVALRNTSGVVTTILTAEMFDYMQPEGDSHE